MTNERDDAIEKALRDVRFPDPSGLMITGLDAVELLAVKDVIVRHVAQEVEKAVAPLRVELAQWKEASGLDDRMDKMGVNQLTDFAEQMQQPSPCGVSGHRMVDWVGMCTTCNATEVGPTTCSNAWHVGKGPYCIRCEEVKAAEQRGYDKANRAAKRIARYIGIDTRKITLKRIAAIIDEE